MWPTEFVWRDALPRPDRWTRPGIVMFFNAQTRLEYLLDELAQAA